MSDVRYTDQHEWIRLEGDEATVGITKFAAESLGEHVIAATIAPFFERRIEVHVAGTPTTADVRPESKVRVPGVENETGTEEKPIAANTEAHGRSMQGMDRDRFSLQGHDVPVRAPVKEVCDMRIDGPSSIAGGIEELGSSADLCGLATLQIANEQRITLRQCHAEACVHFFADRAVGPDGSATVVPLKRVPSNDEAV